MKHLLLAALFSVTTLQAQTITYKVLKDFDGADGERPWNQAILASDGKLYGTTQGGGPVQGVIYRVNPDGSGFEVIHNFVNATGFLPDAGVIEGSDGKLYGATTLGGANNIGVIFSMDKDGANYTVIHTMVEATDGKQIEASLIEAADGRLYGVAKQGGANTYGTIFGLDKDGGNFTVLLSPMIAQQGDAPIGALLQASVQGGGPNGRIYGTFSNIVGAEGVVFAIDTNGSNYQELHRIREMNNDGRKPMGALAKGPDGRLYGTTFEGGVYDLGVIFAVAMDGSSYEVLHDFSAGALGCSPEAGVTFGADGLLYGTTSTGGSINGGVVYRMKPDGTNYQVIHDLAPVESGVVPRRGPLTVGGNGIFYGTTAAGGATSDGVLFRLLITKPKPPTPPVAAPTVKVLGKKKKIHTTNSNIKLRGTATSAVTVQYKTGKGGPKKAKGTFVWKAKVKLKPGKNVVKITALNSVGVSSPTAKVTVFRD